MLDVTFYSPRVMMVIFSFSSQDGRGGNSTILRLGGDGRMRGRESVVGSLRGGRYFVVILRCNFELASMSVSYKWRDKVMTGGEGCVWR